MSPTDAASVAMALSERERRWRRIERLWRNGQTKRAIAQRLGYSDARVGAEIAKMRAAGRDVPRRTAWNPERIAARREQLAVLWEQGSTTTEIADALEMTMAATQSEIRRMRRAGWPLEYRREPQERPAPVRARLNELWAGGASIAQIADALAISASDVATRVAVARHEGYALERRRGTVEVRARRERIAELYRHGEPLAAIAAEVGGTARSVGAIVSQLRGEGVDLPRRVSKNQGAEPR